MKNADCLRYSIEISNIIEKAFISVSMFPDFSMSFNYDLRI